jgi:hypothetical protein
MKVMKRGKLVYSLAGLTIMFIILIFVRERMESNSDIPALPPPSEESLTEHERREQWLESMHQAAPGVNWRMMNLEERLTRMKRYHLRRSQARNGGVSIGGTLDGIWQEIGSRNQSGRIHVAELDTLNQMLYCASSGGQIWRTPAQTMQWEVLTDHFQVKGIHMLRVMPYNNGQRFVIASDAFSTPGVYYSDDSCKTWTPATGTQTASWGYVRRAVVANDTVQSIWALALGWSGTSVVRVLKSDDLGQSFQEVLSFPETQVGSIRKCDLWTDRYGTGRVFFAKEGALYEIVQGQLVLKGAFITSAGQQVRLTGFERGAGATLYAMNVLSGNGAVYKSENDGVSWSYKGSAPESPFMINSFSCSSTNSAQLYFGGVEAYRSPTSGVNWYVNNAWQDYYSNVNFALHADIPGIYSFKTGNQEVVYICTDGGIYRSNNAMQTVTNLSLLDLNVSQYYSVYTSRVNTNFIHAGSQDQGYQRSTLQPGPVKNFDQIWSGDYGHIVTGDSGSSIWMNYPGFTVYYNDILYSTNRTTWQFDWENALWIPPMMIDPYDHFNVILAGGGYPNGAFLVMLTHMGVGSQMVKYIYPFDFSFGNASAKISAVASSPVDINCWYVLTSDGKFFHSPDAGTTWSLKHNFNYSFGHYFYGADILPSPNEAGKAYICGSGYSNPPVWELTNFGTTARAISQGIPSTLVYALECTPEEGLLFAATELGPFVFFTGEEKWYDLSQGIAPDQTYWSVEYIESLKKARFGTYGRGIWDFTMCGSPSTQPVAGFTYSPGTAYLEVQFQDQSTGNPFTWLWDFGDGRTSTLPSPVHFYSTPGTYTVRLITGNICKRDTIYKTIQVTQTGVTEATVKKQLFIYPNPVSSELFVKFPGVLPSDVNIYDIQGKQIGLRKLRHGTDQILCQVDDLPQGVYWIAVNSGNQIITRKFVVSRK